MTLDEMRELFKKHEDEYLEDDRITDMGGASRKDVAALVLLDRLVPDKRRGDILGSAEHDVVFFSVDIKDLAPVITEEQVVYLIRCGIRYNDEYDSLYTFV